MPLSFKGLIDVHQTSADFAVSLTRLPFNRSQTSRTLFVPVTLTLTWWPWYVNLTEIFWRCTRCIPEMKFLAQCFQMLEPEHDRQTDRRDRTYYHAAFPGGKQCVLAACMHVSAKYIGMQSERVCRRNDRKRQQSKLFHRQLQSTTTFYWWCSYVLFYSLQTFSNSVGK